LICSTIISTIIGIAKCREIIKHEGRMSVREEGKKMMGRSKGKG